MYGGNFYAGEDDEVTMTLGYNGTLAEEYFCCGYSVNAGTLNGNILKIYGCTLENCDFTVNGGSLTTNADISSGKAVI